MKKFTFLLIVFAFIGGSNIVAQDVESEVISGWSKGNQNAKVRLEVFNDYQCPSCTIFNEKLKIFESKFSNDLQITFRHFPLTMIHKNAMSAAQAVEAAGMQGKFWEMSDLILEEQQKWATKESAEKMFVKYARKLGLDIEKFKSDLESETVKNRIDADVKRAKSLSLSGTPTVLLNDRKLGFAELDELEKLANEILSK